jgi:hypothetical protein
MGLKTFVQHIFLFVEHIKIKFRLLSEKGAKKKHRLINIKTEP